MTECSPVYPECSRNTRPNPDCRCSPVPPLIGGEQVHPGGRPTGAPSTQTERGTPDFIAPHERFHLYGVDPADLLAALEGPGEYIAQMIASLSEPWTRQALCLGEPIEWFFPGKGERNDAAMELCGSCPVRTECLAEALADPDLDHGIRGGMTANARKAARKARRARS